MRKKIVDADWETDLNWVLVGEEVDDFEGMGNNTKSEKLLAVIAALHHETNHELTRLTRPLSCDGPAPVHQSLDNRHLGLLKLLFGITASSVRKVHGMVDLDVVVEGDVFDFDPETRLEPDNLRYIARRTRESPTFQRA